jgi:peptidylprolyl isomerase
MSLGMVLLLGTVLTVPLAACGDGDEEASPTPTTPATQVEGGPPAVSGEPTVTASGLQIIDIEVGTGDSPQSGQTVEVHYTGWLADGTKFDSSLDKGQPFSFVLGAGRVIAGWDEGVASMKVDGKRRLIIPPELGYGAGGYPPVIPANAVLTFDVELLAIK